MNDAPMVVEQSAMEIANRADIEMQISTARKYPRSVQKASQAIVTMATMDEDTAAACGYVIPRDGKEIDGPSVRLAEIAASQWGNMRIKSYVVDIGQKFVTAEGVAHDLESNMAYSIQVRRRITKSSGQRYSDDMIMTTANAACSVAFREVTFKAIPRAYVNKAYHAARRIAVGDESKLPERREKMLKRFAVHGVTSVMILQFVARPSIEEVGLADLQRLMGVYTAVADGDVSVREVFGGQKSEPKPAPAPKSEPAPAAVKPEPVEAAAPAEQKEEVPAAAPPPAEEKPKGRGRPKGAKNKAKAEPTPPAQEEAPVEPAPKQEAPAGQSPQQEYETLLLQLETQGKGEQLSTVMQQSVKVLDKTIDEFTDDDYVQVNAELRKALNG